MLKISNDNNTDKTDVIQSSLKCKQNSLNFKQTIAHIRMYYMSGATYKFFTSDRTHITLNIRGTKHSRCRPLKWFSVT